MVRKVTRLEPTREHRAGRARPPALEPRAAASVLTVVALAYATGIGPALLAAVLLPLLLHVRDRDPRAAGALLGVASLAVVLAQLGIAAEVVPTRLPALGGHLAAAGGLLLLWAVGLGVARFALDHQDAHARLASEEAHVRALLAHASDVTTVVTDARITYLSPSTERLLGFHPTELVGTPYLELIHPDDRATTIDFVRELLGSPGGSGLVECRLRTRDGGWVPVESSCRNLLHDPAIRGVVVNSRDISERKELEQQLEHRALHDPMTGLANRALLLDRLEHTGARALRTGTRYAVLLVDLDDFKPVNDTLGPGVGDAVLATIARRLQGVIRAADTVARVGGDEFAVLIEETRSDADAAKAAARVLAAVSRPIHAAGSEVTLTASIGIAYDEGGGTPTNVLRNADIAMYLAKRAGKDRFEIFEAAMHVQVIERLQLEADLHQAVTEDQLRVHYQPIVSLADRRVVGFEALVRWEHPVHGTIPPGRFIPLAEETGVIVPIGRYVLREACRQVSCWRARLPGADRLTISVNLSMRQLLVGDIVDDVRRALLDAGLPAPALTLELTESMIATDAEQAVEALRRLKALGVKLAIDDFGTGYSSLSYLHRFPVDVLKIDRSFVSSVAAGEQPPALARAIVDLGRSLDLSTVAEGIERDLELTQFRKLGCTHGQGYLFARPADAETAERFLVAELAGTTPTASTASASSAASAVGHG